MPWLQRHTSEGLSAKLWRRIMYTETREEEYVPTPPEFKELGIEKVSPTMNTGIKAS